jgi:hypothetical protein
MLTGPSQQSQSTQPGETLLAGAFAEAAMLGSPDKNQVAD